MTESTASTGMTEEATAAFYEIVRLILVAPQMTEELDERSRQLPGEVPDDLFRAVTANVEGMGFTYYCVQAINGNDGKPNPHIAGSSGLSVNGDETYSPYIRIKDGMSPASRLMVELHETAHLMLMHQGAGSLGDEMSDEIRRVGMESEAEIVAGITGYLLGHRHLETSANYVASFLHELDMVSAMGMLGQMQPIVVSAAVNFYGRIMGKMEYLAAAGS